MKTAFILFFVGLFFTSSFAYTCPDGSTTAISIQTCSDSEKVNNECPPVSSNGLNLQLDGSQDAPEWLWGSLAEDANWKSQFYYLYEVDSTGNLIDGSITELNTFSWTYCTPISSGSSVSFTAYGTKDDQGILITGTVNDSSNTKSFKWNFQLDNYIWFNGTPNDLVLYSKYETEGGDDSATEDNPSDPDNSVVNQDSYINTAKSAQFYWTKEGSSSQSSTSVSVTSSAQDNGNSGYFIKFGTSNPDLAGTFNSLQLDPTFGFTSIGAIPLVSIFGLVVFALLALF